MTLRLNGATSGYCEIDAPAVAGTTSLTLPNANGTLDRLNRAGNILQVVNATYSTSVSNSTSTYTDTGLTATITPTSATSKILVLISQSGCYKDTANTSMKLQLLRGATVLALLAGSAGANDTINANDIGSIAASYLDSPATTSATTYKTQFGSTANIARVLVQTNSAAVSTITLMEVAA